MNSSKIPGIIGFGIGIAMVLFILSMAWSMFPDDSDMDGFAAFKYFFTLIGVFMLAIMIWGLYKMLRTPVDVAPPANDPLNGPMSYERREYIRYCPYCNANLGTSDPAVCPECKRKLKNDFYHQ